MSPDPEEEQEEAEGGESTSRAQGESRGETESQLGLRNHPAGGLRETLAGPEQRNQPGPSDLVQEREGWFRHLFLVSIRGKNFWQVWLFLWKLVLDEIGLTS